MVPKKGLVPPSFGNSFSLNKIAASLDYNRLADFATKGTDSNASSNSIEFVEKWTPRSLDMPRRMDTSAIEIPRNDAGSVCGKILPSQARGKQASDPAKQNGSAPAESVPPRSSMRRLETVKSFLH